MDKVKTLLAQDFEQRLKKQEQAVKKLNEEHAKKIQSLKMSEQKEKEEMKVKFEQDLESQKS